MDEHEPRDEPQQPSDGSPPTDPGDATPPADLAGTAEAPVPTSAPPPPPPTPGQPGPPAQWAEPMSRMTTQGPSNGFATAALVLGIIALVAFWTIWFGVLLGGLAIVFGALGMSKANAGAPNKGLAIAGMVLGIIALASSLLFFVAVVRVASDEGLLEDIGNQIELCIESPNDPSC